MGSNTGYNHPMYIAVAEINYSNSDKAATVVCKTFSDDLELALQKQYHTNEKINDAGNSKKLSAEIEGYIKSHLQLIINGKAANLVFTGFKKEDNTVLINFSIADITDIRRFEVNVTIFYELYDKQIQLVYVTVNGNRKSNRLINPESKIAFNF